jgi:hypothetical protein
MVQVFGSITSCRRAVQHWWASTVAFGHFYRRTAAVAAFWLLSWSFSNNRFPVVRWNVAPKEIR